MTGSGNFLTGAPDALKNGTASSEPGDVVVEEEPEESFTREKSFHFISRRQRQLAGKAMLAATREMSPGTLGKHAAPTRTRLAWSFLSDFL